MATYQEQRERDYQNKLVKRFVDELDYKYLGNWQYAKGETVNSLGKQNSPILDDEVRKFLKDQNGTLGDLIADLEHSDCTFVNNNKADVIARLKSLNEASWRTHHASVEERAVYHEQTLTMAAAVGYVNKALQMLQKEL